MQLCRNALRDSPTLARLTATSYQTDPTMAKAKAKAKAPAKKPAAKAKKSSSSSAASAASAEFDASAADVVIQACKS